MTPTEFMIEQMSSIDDVEIIVCIRKTGSGMICYDSNTNSNFHIYGMVNIVKAFVEADLIKGEIER